MGCLLPMRFHGPLQEFNVHLGRLRTGGERVESGYCCVSRVGRRKVSWNPDAEDAFP